MIQLRFTNLPIDEVNNDLLVLLLFEDTRPLKATAGWVDWRLNGRLSRLILNGKIQGSCGESMLMPSEGRLDSKEVLLFGIGKKEKLSDPEVASLIDMILKKLELKKTYSFAISFSETISDLFEWRNAIRIFSTRLSGSKTPLSVSIVGPNQYIEEVKKRHMEFPFDVKAHYEVV